MTYGNCESKKSNLPDIILNTKAQHTETEYQDSQTVERFT